MKENILTFMLLAGLMCAGFSATFLGLVPELGTGWSHLDTGLADARGHHAHFGEGVGESGLGAVADVALSAAQHARQLKGGGGGAHATGAGAPMLDGSGAARLFWSLSSAPYLPIFALYGDLGVMDLEEIAYKGSSLNWGFINWAAVASWVYLFVSNILLINILIAMLSETCDHFAWRSNPPTLASPHCAETRLCDTLTARLVSANGRRASEGGRRRRVDAPARARRRRVLRRQPLAAAAALAALYRSQHAHCMRLRRPAAPQHAERQAHQPSDPQAPRLVVGAL